MPSSENESNKAQKTMEVWSALRQFGQPVFATTIVGSAIHRISESEMSDTLKTGLSAPLVFLALASFVNASKVDTKEIIRNYTYYPCIGMLLAASVFVSPFLKEFFLVLDDHWFKNVFVTTVLAKDADNEARAMAFRVSAAFHTFYNLLQPRIYRFIYSGEFI